MPIYNFKCLSCEHTRRRLFNSEETAKVAVVICDCGDFMERDAQPPSARVTEVLDNGSMIRKVERLHNAEEIYKERSRNDSK